MPRTFIGLFLCLLLPCGTAAQAGTKSSGSRFDNNPMMVVEYFLDDFYPTLAERGGEFTFRAYHATGGGIFLAGVSVYFKVCSISGVPGQAYRATAPPSCGSPSEPDVMMNLDFDLRPDYPPLKEVWVKEIAVSKKRAKLEEMATGPGASNLETLLENLDAKFGPSKRRELLATIPAAKIEEYTGCVLDKSTTHFISETDRVGWVIEGLRKGTEDPCFANFDPFEGKLAAIF